MSSEQNHSGSGDNVAGNKIVTNISSSSKVFTVCQHATRSGDFRAFKEGWSWPAFFFSFAWLIFSKLYRIYLTYVFAFILLLYNFNLIDQIFDTSSKPLFKELSLIVMLLSPFILGLTGNKLLKEKYCKWEYDLSMDHYLPKATISANNKDAAIAIYLNNHVRDELNAI